MLIAVSVESVTYLHYFSFDSSLPAVEGILVVENGESEGSELQNFAFMSLDECFDYLSKQRRFRIDCREQLLEESGRFFCFSGLFVELVMMLGLLSECQLPSKNSSAVRMDSYLESRLETRVPDH